MTEHQRKAAERTAAERYYAQYAELGVGPRGSPEAALQEAINDGAPELEADQRDARPHERRRLPSVGHVRVLLRLEFSWAERTLSRSATYRTLPEQVHYDDGGEYVAQELEGEKANSRS